MCMKVHLEILNSGRPPPCKHTHFRIWSLTPKTQSCFVTPYSDNANVEFEYVEHPVFGVIVCLIADEDINADEELFVNYNYVLEDAAKWYRDLYDETYG